MSSFNSSDPLIYMIRSGQVGDEYVLTSNSYKIINNKILLNELPVRLNRISIPSYFEISGDDGKAPASNEVVCDYTTGILTFNPSEEGKTVTVSSYSRGAVYIPSSRIWTQQQNGVVTQTLDSLTAAASQFVSKGLYSPSTIYYNYNIVRYQNSSYMYTAVTSSSGSLPTDTTKWTKIVGLTAMSSYSTSATYSAGDMVSDALNQNVYQSLVDSNTNQPLTDITKWQLMISVSSVVSTANTAISNANTATGSANSATTNANNAATAANTAKTNADTATSAANTATGLANTATTNANNATASANNLVTTSVAKGVYAFGTSYVVNNTVSYNGSSWRCILNSTGNAPVEGTYWTLIAAAGSVASVTSANSDITVANPTSSPTLTVNTGQGANQLPKRDVNGNIPNIGNQVIPISANTTVTAAQSGIINVTTGASVITITLPTAVSNAQLVYTIKKADSGVGTVSIVTTSSQTIDGVTSKTLTSQYAVITVVSDGANWIVDVGNYRDDIGILSNLPTTDKSSTVAAINEIWNYPISNMARQALINGNFDVWQRGTIFTNPLSGAYTADRWYVTFSGSGQAHTVSRQQFTMGQPDVPNEPKYFFRYQVTTPATGQTWNIISQKVESVRTLAGKKATISFYAKADSNRSLTISPHQIFGTGGSPSADVFTQSKVIALTSTWQKFTHTFDLPSISGKTLGTNGDDSIALDMNLPLNTILTIDIAEAGINAGDQALPFQPKSYQEEEFASQRFNYRITANSTGTYTTFGIGQAYSTTQAKIYIPLPRAMRVLPTLTSSSLPQFALIDALLNSLAVTAMTVDTQRSNQYNCIVLNVTVASGLVAGNAVQLTSFNNGTTFLNLDAEL